MLDMSKLKRGDTVYKVEWIDLPDLIEPTPFIRSYCVTQLGKEYMAVVRQFGIKRLAGQLGHKDKAVVETMRPRFSHTPSEAVDAEYARLSGNRANALRVLREVEFQTKLLQEMEQSLE